jgi:hypothetical protein
MRLLVRKWVGGRRECKRVGESLVWVSRLVSRHPFRPGQGDVSVGPQRQRPANEPSDWQNMRGHYRAWIHFGRNSDPRLLMSVTAISRQLWTRLDLARFLG